MLRACFCLLALAILSGCEKTEAGDQAHVTVRDSAGISIVESQRPTLSIGAVEGGDANTAAQAGDATSTDGPASTPARVPRLTLERLLRVDGQSVPFGEVGGVTADGEGRMFVSDVQARQVVVLGPGGSQLAVFGRQGNGPGEFMRLVGDLVWDGDALVTADAQLRRITLFGPDGEVLGTRPLPQLAEALPAGLAGVPTRSGATNLAGVFAADGAVHLLVHVSQARALSGGSFADPAPPAPAPEARYVRLGADGTAAVLGLIDTVPWPTGTECAPPDMARIHLLSFPLFLRQGPPRTFLPSGEAALAHAEHYRIDVVDPASGDLVRSVTRDVEPRPLLDADWEALPEVRTLRAHEQQSTGPLRGRGGVPCPLDGMRPDVFPVIRALFADEVGRLWVEAVTREGTVLAAHAPDGRLVGEAAMPVRDERVRPFVRDGLLYLVTVDALGVQSVEVHRVVGLEP